MVLRRNEGLPLLTWKGFLRRWHKILRYNDKKELKKPITPTQISIKNMSLLKKLQKNKLANPFVPPHMLSFKQLQRYQERKGIHSSLFS